MQKAILEIKIDSNNTDLIETYKTHIKNHNQSILDNEYPNAGFDLFIPDDIEFTEPFVTKMVDLKIKMQMWHYDEYKEANAITGYYMYPRSSMSKTPLMLANQVGIIDSGYRNNLMAALRYLTPPTSNTQYVLEKNTRLVQICHPSLCPIMVQLLDANTELTVTERKGGFGSTGIVGQFV
jgi:dUTP pyrophosphatase